MLDLRYHVASLAAVFIALAVGIVIGVAIASGGGVEGATKDILEGQNQRLEQQLDAAQHEIQSVQDRSRAVTALMESVYPSLIAERLSARRIALLCLGPVDGCPQPEVEETLTDAGGELVRVTALELPADPDALISLAEGHPALAGLGPDDALDGLATGLGREFADGGATALWEAVDELIVEQTSGSSVTRADGVVVARTWPGAAEDASPEEQRSAAATEQLVAGLLAGLEEAGVPAVGVEALASERSNVSFFRGHGLSSVNDVDTLAGHLALALLLEGAALSAPGSYGIGDEVDAVVPPIDVSPTVTVGG